MIEKYVKELQEGMSKFRNYFKNYTSANFQLFNAVIGEKIKNKLFIELITLLITVTFKCEI